MSWTFSHYDLSLMSFLISFLIFINLTLDSTLHDNSIYQQTALIIYCQTVLIPMEFKICKNFQGNGKLLEILVDFDVHWRLVFAI